MNDAKDQVWRDFQAVLRRRRIRRRAGQSTLLAGLLLVALWRLAGPPGVDSVVVSGGAELPAPLMSRDDGPFMAVYVPTDFGMRLEFVDVGQMAPDVMIPFSLEPVIWQNCAW